MRGFGVAVNSRVEAAGTLLDILAAGDRAIAAERPCETGGSVYGKSASSSKPISSKFEISVKILSGPSGWEEEWNEEDLEDLDPESSGGELGVGHTVVMISCNYSDVLIPAILICLGKKKTQGGSKSTGCPEGVDNRREFRGFWMAMVEAVSRQETITPR